MIIGRPLTAEELHAGLDEVRTRLALSSAVIEITGEPHTGCKKFLERFGIDAVKLVNSGTGRKLSLRGINARVVHPGLVRVGDIAEKL